MADINQKINIKEIVDVSDALKGIKQIQDSLSHLKVGAEAKAGFDRLFSNIQQQAEKANAALATGFKNKGDVTKYKNAMGQIVTNYDEIIRRIEVLKSKDISLDVDVKKLEKAKQDIKDFGTQVDQARKAAEKFLKDSSRTLRDDVGKDRKGQDKWEKVLQAYKEGKIGEATKALGVLKAAMTRAGKNGEDLKSEEWVKYAEDIKKIQIELDAYKAKIKDVDDAQQGLDGSLKTQKQVYDDAKKALEGIGQAATDDAKDVRDFTKATSESAEEAQQLSSELEQFRNKAAYFFGLSNAINLFKRAVRSAYDTVKDLDAVMTETAVVTNFDVGDMWDQLPEYTQRANELGVSIHSAYEAATIFYQQGLKTNEVMAVSNETLKMARIAGLDAATASDRMTNALRGFNMEMDKMSAQRVNDVYSKLAAITASDTDEISTAMTKVASLAHNANMEFETTAAFLAQIIESTRESAETAGTALKTVVARFSEVKELYNKGELLGKDEEGEEIDVNRVSTALRSAGISLNEYLTGAKGLDDIFIELAEKWDSLDIVQQRYIATMAAGSRQQSRFIALMSDYKRTMQLVEAANNAEGASQEQYGKTLESLETKLARLKNAWDEFILGLTNSDAIKGAVDLLTNLITSINKLISTISGKNSGVKMITTFFTAFTGFKIGQKIFGGTSIGKFFEGLVKTGSGEAAKGGLAIAKTFYSNLATSIANYEKNGSGNKIGESIFSAFSSAKKYFLSNEDNQNRILDAIDWNAPGMDNDKLDKIRAVLEQDKVTIGEVNTVLAQTGAVSRETGEALQITEDNFEDFGLATSNDTEVIGKFTNGMRIAATASLALGGILMGLGNWLDTLGEKMRPAASAVKGLGAGLMAFGTIMSVYLPLQAQLMAKEVTAAIVSIPIVGIIAGIIAALTALGVAIYDFTKNNSTETKLENAAAAAKSAADAADEAREAYEKLGEAWNSLDDKYDAIENAVKGTQEWRDAIKEVNSAVLDLMENYGDIRIQRDEDGILTITNRDQVEDMIRGRALTSEAAARASKIRQYQRDQDNNYADLKENYINPSSKIAPLEDKPYQELLLKYQNEGRLDEFNSMDNYTIKTLLENTQAYTDAKVRAVAEGKDLEYNLDDSVWEIRNYVKQYENNIEAMAAERTAFGATVLEASGLDKDSQKYANTLISDEYIDNLIKDSAKLFEGDPLKELQKKYAASFNTSWEQLVEDNPELKDYKEDQLIDFLAAQEALRQAPGQIQTFVDNLEKLNDNETLLLSEQEGGALTKAQAENLDNYSEERKRIVYDELGGDKVFGENGFDEYFSKWWDESVQAALNSFDPSAFGMGVAGRLDKGLTDNLSSSTFTGYLTNLQSVFESSGAAAMNQIQKSISDLTKDMDPKDIDAFVKRINEVNWSSVESIKSLDELAEEFGISQDEIKAFENQIIELNKAVSQFDAEKLISALGLANKIGSGEQGRSFTEEQYKTLLENGLSPDDFQLNIETGNYDYIGEDIQSVRDAILQQTAILQGELERAAASNEAIEELQKDSSPDVNSADSLRQFLNSYIDLAGENSLISRDAIGMGSLEELQNMYNKVMQEYWNAEDTQAKLNQANAYAYQANSGVTNANLALSGDEQAADILKQQLINSGLSEEEYKRLISGINNYDQTTGQYAGTISTAGSVVDTFDKAGQYGIEAEDLNEYVEALRQVDDLQQANTATLYELALANARYQEGFKNVIESYDEWIQLRQEDGSIRAEDGNDIQQKAYTQLKKDLKEMLNLSEDVSDEFMQMPETAELLERAVNGDIEAVAELRANLAKIKITGQFNPVDQDAIYDAIDAFTQESYTLEFGASWNDSALAQGLYDALVAAGATVDQINEAFGNIGWTPPVETEVVQIKDVVQTNGTGYQEIVRPDGSIERIPVESLYTENQEGYITVPVVGENAHFVPPEMPSYTPSSSSGGGGGGGSEKKPSYWENPYDELYNLQEKINEALRTREALERRYQKLLKEEKATLSDIRKAYYSQIANLRAEADLQKQFAAGRLRQIQNIGEQMYTDSEGDRSSFNSWGVTKYASYDANTGLIQIDWNGLEEIANDSDREEEGKAAEAYISKLEELTSSYEEVRDKLWEIEDEIENLREAAIESYLSFEDRVLEALVNSYQQQIDSYQAMSDSLEKASNEVLTSLREQIELSRQIRDNTDKEKQIADMENRLAYLQRDTSNSNALEIQKLQKDLEDARENYTDTLVDQAIEKMQNEADLAAEQRARQIETMQEQLEIMKDTGALWQQVYDLMDEAAEGNGALSPKTTLVELLKDTEAFTSLSNIGQAKWWSEVAEEFHAAWVGRDEAEDKYKTDANNDGIIANSGTSAAISSVSATADSVSPTSSSSSSSSGPSDADEAGVAMNICGPNNGWGDGETRRNRLEEKGFDYWSVQSIVNDIVNSGWDDSYYRRKYGISDLSDYSYYAFKTGGLADFTGPAWLDGTKAKPELILNAQDSANFIALKDILASLLNVQGGGLNGTKNGDNYFDIDISANIGSDYDVDRLAEKLKQNIYNDGQYRNVNTINFLR